MESHNYKFTSTFAFQIRTATSNSNAFSAVICEAVVSNPVEPLQNTTTEFVVIIFKTRISLPALVLYEMARIEVVDSSNIFIHYFFNSR